MSARIAQELRQNGLLVITLEGRLDSMGVEQVQEAFGEAIGDYTGPFVVDMRGVTYLSSAGLALLVSKGRAQRGRGGDLIVVTTNPDVLEVFELTGFGGLFSMYNGLEAAVAAAEATRRG